MPTTVRHRVYVETTLCLSVETLGEASEADIRRAAAQLAAEEIGDGLSLPFSDSEADARLYITHDRTTKSGKHSVRGTFIAESEEVTKASKR